MKVSTAAATGAAGIWALLVAGSPPWFFAAAAPLAAVWLLLSARAAPPGLSARLRPRWGDAGIALSAALLLYAGTRVFLWATCGGVSDVLCVPLASMYDRFATRGVLPALALGLIVAPAEEMFWRGFVQERLVLRLGPAPGVAAATALAVAAALATGEPFLALATAPTYAIWGAIAAWRRSLVPSILSHAAWSVLVASVAPPT